VNVNRTHTRTHARAHTYRHDYSAVIIVLLNRNWIET